MKKILITMLTILSTSASSAADLDRLMVEQCSSCHGPEVYTRPDRIVKDMGQLHNQLQRCNHALTEKMSAETISRLADYLNTKYYKF